jgi:Na+/proline symporter
VILLLLWKRARDHDCIAGMVVGFVAAAVWPQVCDQAATGIHIHNLPLAHADSDNGIASP